MTSRLLVALPERLPGSLLALLAELATYCELEPARQDRVSTATGAIVAAPGPWPGIPEDVPVAMWADDVSGLRDTGSLERAAAVLSESGDVLECAGARALRLPDPQRAVAGARSMPPHVRARLARAHGLPVDALFELHDGTPGAWCGHPVAADLCDTALGVASAVAATGAESVTRALAWAAPTVTDRATAAALELRDGSEVIVASAEQLVATAVDMARDADTAATLSRQGRTWYEQRHDVRRAAAVLAMQLDIRPIGRRRLDLAADELGAPADARSRTRAGMLVAHLEGLGVTG